MCLFSGSVYFPPVSPTKQVVVAPSSAVCSGISTQTSVTSQGSCDGEALLSSQGPDDRPEFKAIERMNIVSVSGDWPHLI